MRVLTAAVPLEYDGRPLRHFLRGGMKLSSTLLKSLKWREGAILLNGRSVHVNAVTRAGDQVTVTLDERAVGATPPVALPLDVVWEDEDLLVLNKPAELAMHPGATDLSSPSLAGALVSYLGEGSVPHFVSRLDKGTSGLLIAAKTGYTHELLRRALHTQALHREYRALALGTPNPTTGRVELPIGRDESSLVKRRIDPTGLASLTEYETLDVRGGLTLLRLVPHTGRTHQLRVHMAALGCPLAGDWLYGEEAPELIRRPALHSYFLRFAHPLSGKTLSFTAPLPPDMARLWQRGHEIK